MTKKLMPWGRFPNFPQTPHSCHWRSELPHLLAQLKQDHTTILPFGNGRSYGDSCLATSDHVLHLRSLDRFISADWENGIITAESGMTLEELLSYAIPHGWFLPVTPGTKFVTLGGAVANDIHGKNHHRRGAFGRHVSKLSLVRSDGPPVLCSPQENTELFTATIGGLGLTGIIEWIELKLIPIQSSSIDTIQIRFGSLDEFFALSAELDDKHEYTVAWIDCLAKAGRGIYIAGNHSEKGALTIDKAKKMRIPFTPPFSAINRLTLRMFNALYYYLHKPERTVRTMSYEPFFFPLDGILHWNRIYGPRGFQQYQCVIPDRFAKSAIRELLDVIASSGSGSFLAVLKRCGNAASPGLLSFPFPGVTLALDFPNKDTALFSQLDAIVKETRGRLYPAKDAHMSADDFRQFYPAWKQVEALRDPAICSRFWKRVIT
jgi:FAD/FMN-containing dehydrogenase